MNAHDFTCLTGLRQWLSVKGFFTIEEAIALQNLVKSLPKGMQIVELGTFQGRSTVAIGSVLPEGGRLFCVDTFENTVIAPNTTKPPLETVVKENLRALHSNLTEFGIAGQVQVLVMRTTEAAPRFPSDSLDLVLIDAGHRLEDVQRDIFDWYPKLKTGGFMVFDDVEPAWPGVVQAVKESGLKGGFIAPSLWVHRKSENSAPAFGIGDSATTRA
jgi:predicted O-methyltransferase YrrM